MTSPLLQDILGFLHDGRQLTEIRPDKAGGRRRWVEFVFSDGASEVREYECDHATILGWWEQSTGYQRSTTDAFRQTACWVNAIRDGPERGTW